VTTTTTRRHPLFHLRRRPHRQQRRRRRRHWLPVLIALHRPPASFGLRIVPLEWRYGAMPFGVDPCSLILIVRRLPIVFRQAEPDAGLSRFPRMRIPDERLNLVILAVVTLFTAAIATGAAFMQRPAAAKKPIYLADQTPVRVVGPPFVPNNNPRER
jgi:hypothetical protein